MICVAVVYPNETGMRFDLEYYRDRHLPLVKDCYGPYGLSRIELDEAVSKSGKNAAPYIAIAHMMFPSMDDFIKAYREAGEQVMADIPSFTDIDPVIQISQRVTI